jgi:hypothetical protein
MANYPPRMIATNKESGKVVWETNLSDGQAALQFSAAPLAVKDKIVVGASGGGGVRCLGVDLPPERWPYPPLVTLPPSRFLQKSGLSAVGTSEYVPGCHWGFSAQTSSIHSSKARRNVTVADQGIVKTPSSSTLTWIWTPLPL